MQFRVVVEVESIVNKNDPCTKYESVEVVDIDFIEYLTTPFTIYDWAKENGWWINKIRSITEIKEE